MQRFPPIQLVRQNADETIACRGCIERLHRFGRFVPGGVRARDIGPFPTAGQHDGHTTQPNA
jgi:hypothetical protein